MLVDVAKSLNRYLVAVPSRRQQKFRDRMMRFSLRKEKVKGKKVAVKVDDSPEAATEI